MTNKVRATIEFDKSDGAYLNTYKDSVESLYEVVIEIMTIHSSMLLTPVFREMVLKAARDVEQKHKALHFMLCVDNPGKPLGEEQS